LIDEEQSSKDDSDSESESASASSDSDSESSNDNGEEKRIRAYVASIFEKNKENPEKIPSTQEEDIITLPSETLPPLPRLDPGKLPPPYIRLGKTRFDGPISIRDPDVELALAAAASHSAPAPPIPPPELTSSGKPLTKRQKKELKHVTSGPDWFDLPAPSEADLPRLYREVEALRLRNQLDSKRFYRKDEGEGQGIKGLPKFFAIGTILPSTTPFGTASSDNLTRANRKRTLVDELVDDAEAKRYAKKKFEDLQSVRGAKGRNTLHAKQAMRRRKW